MDLNAAGQDNRPGRPLTESGLQSGVAAGDLHFRSGSRGAH